MRLRDRRTHAFAAAALAAFSLVLAACGGDPDVGDVRDALAEEVPARAEQQAPQVDFDPDSVTCPEEQSVAEGERFECTIAAIESGTDVVYTIAVEMTGEGSFDWVLTGVEPAGG